MHKQCDIVRDILPLYVDGACSEASAELVREHLNACPDCKVIYQKLLSRTNEELLQAEGEGVIMRHEAKEKRKGRKSVTIAVLLSLLLCATAIFTVLCLLPINIPFGETKLQLAFDASDVESVEMYHYTGTPALAEKKTITDKQAIQALYEALDGLALKRKSITGSADEAKVTSFRFKLSDGAEYALVYTEYGVKRGMLSMESGTFEFFTSANIGWYWTQLDPAAEAVPAGTDELPR